MGYREKRKRNVDSKFAQRRTGTSNKINRSDAICILKMCIIFRYRIMHV